MVDDSGSFCAAEASARAALGFGEMTPSAPAEQLVVAAVCFAAFLESRNLLRNIRNHGEGP